MSSRRYFEDFEEGFVFECRVPGLASADITEFAALYDPQRFHLDEEDASRDHAGGCHRDDAIGAFLVLLLLLLLLLRRGLLGRFGSRCALRRAGRTRSPLALLSLPGTAGEEEERCGEKDGASEGKERTGYFEKNFCISLMNWSLSSMKGNIPLLSKTTQRPAESR